jgi:hypothetical protein
MVRLLRDLRRLTLVLCLPLMGVSSVSEAQAEPDSRDREELLRTIRELTERVRELEAQVRTMSRADARGAGARLSAAGELACSSPFFMGADGVRRVRLECLNQPESQDSCESPFVLDASGIKRVKRACLTSMQ